MFHIEILIVKIALILNLTEDQDLEGLNPVKTRTGGGGEDTRLKLWGRSEWVETKTRKNKVHFQDHCFNIKYLLFNHPWIYFKAKLYVLVKDTTRQLVLLQLTNLWEDYVVRQKEGQAWGPGVSSLRSDISAMLVNPSKGHSGFLQSGDCAVEEPSLNSQVSLMRRQWDGCESSRVIRVPHKLQYLGTSQGRNTPGWDAWVKVSDIERPEAPEDHSRHHWRCVHVAAQGVCKIINIWVWQSLALKYLYLHLYLTLYHY